MTKFQEGKVPIIWILHPQPRIPVANEGKGTVTHNICNPWDDLYNLRIHECLIFMVSWDWYNLPTVSWLIFVGFSCKEIYYKKSPQPGMRAFWSWKSLRESLEPLSSLRSWPVNFDKNRRSQKLWPR